MPAVKTKRTQTAVKPKETNVMGRVTTTALIENSEDKWAVRRGLLEANDARQVVVPDALIDTGATLLSLPKKLIKQLGLLKIGERRVTTSVGVRTASLYGPVLLTIEGRSCTVDVGEVPNSVPTLVGQVPLELLDFVVDLRERKLIGNPAHGGEHMYELF